jgi:hypothetical protein
MLNAVKSLLANRHEILRFTQGDADRDGSKALTARSLVVALSYEVAHAIRWCCHRS